MTEATGGFACRSIHIDIDMEELEQAIATLIFVSNCIKLKELTQATDHPPSRSFSSLFITRQSVTFVSADHCLCILFVVFLACLLVSFRPRRWILIPEA